MFGDKIQGKGYLPVRLSSSFVLGQKTMGSHLQSVSQLQSFVPRRPFGVEVVTIFIKDTDITNQRFTEGSSNKKTRRKKSKKKNKNIYYDYANHKGLCLSALKEMLSSPRCKNPQLTSRIQHSAVSGFDAGSRGIGEANGSVSIRKIK